MALEVSLGLGGNLGDPVAAFAAAIARLQAQPGIAPRLRCSSVYRTAPWGKLDQPDFLNMALLLETDLAADALLALCLLIERESGRERRERWGPRTLDIDILTYGDRAIDQPGLQVPHPRIAERAFVLAPLAEIAPATRIAGSSVADLLAAIGSQDVRRDEAATQRLRELRPVDQSA